jgi:hypothetical protein
MSKLTDSELQALVFQTGITPCDRLPKPDPRYELNSLLHCISNFVNGAVKAGNSAVTVETTGFPKWSEKALRDAAPVLTQLGYKTEIKPVCDGISITISGWL